MEGLEALADVAGADRTRVLVRRISEEVQKDEGLMFTLRRIGALPDRTVFVSRTEAGIHAGSGGEAAEIDLEAASHIFVRRL
jgi:DtxR family Mn-dependent transcriptional regulator